MKRTPRALLGIAVAATLAFSIAGPADAHDRGHHGHGHGHGHGHQHPQPDPVRVITQGLEGPFQVSSYGRDLLVTESGTGRVLAVDPRDGEVETVVDGLGAGAPAGAVQVGRKTFVVTGEADPSQPAGPQPGSSVLVAERGKVRQFADLMAAELKDNPDGQKQFGPDGAPLDALSNPFSLLADRSTGGAVLVADGGANTVWRVDRRGKVTPFFTPPTVNTGACAGRPNNDPEHTGCDAVPTGLAYGPRGSLYVSALTGEAPGEGRVYVLDARTGELRRTISGFTSPTGIAVDDDGTMYLSEVLEGSPEGEPPAGFDPSTVGQLVKMTWWGKKSYAQVTMPTGVLWRDGRLYSSAWSIASFMGMAKAGQVVEVSDRAFKR